jgi:hypothetical protein
MMMQFISMGNARQVKRAIGTKRRAIWQEKIAELCVARIEAQSLLVKK